MSRKAKNNQTYSMRGLISFGVLIVMFSALCSLLFSISSSNLQYEISSKTHEKQEVLEENERLQSEVWKLLSISRLNKEADKYNMKPVPPEEYGIISIKRKEVRFFNEIHPHNMTVR